MTAQQVIDIATKVNQIDPRINTIVEGGTIRGCFRGKQNENYQYMVTERSFVFNNEGPNVRKAFEKAIEQLGL
jgi:hypothetical protein